MKNEFLEIKEKFDRNINSFLIPVLSDIIDEQINFAVQLKDTVITHHSDLREFINNDELFYNEISEYHKRIIKLTDSKYADKQEIDFNKRFPEFFNWYESLLDSIETAIVENQDADRFKTDAGDSFYVKSFKSVKSTLFRISSVPQEINNLFRKLFKKSVLPIRPWKRKVLLRDLVEFSIGNEICDEINVQLREIFALISEISLKLWHAEEKLQIHFTSDLKNISTEKLIQPSDFLKEFEKEYSSVVNMLNEKNQNLKKIFSDSLSIAYQNFENQYYKAGTIEFPSRKYSGKILKKHSKDFKVRFVFIFSGWRNTLFALFEDWKLNKDIYFIEVEQVKEYLYIKKEDGKKIRVNILPWLNNINDILEKSRNNIINSKGIENLKNLILGEKDKINSLLTLKHIPEAIELILDQNYPELVNHIEIKLKEFEDDKVKRAIVKTDIYDKEIKTSQLEYIRPSELIKFEIIPTFLNETMILKTFTIEKIDSIQKNLVDIDQISDFNLESALAALANPTNKDYDPRSVAVEGLERAIAKTNDIKTELLEISEKNVTNIAVLIEKFNKQLLELTDTNNITEVRLRIAKAKAVARTKQLKNQVFNSTKNMIPGFLTYIKSGFNVSSTAYKEFRIKFGLDRTEISIASEISDFLSETETAINKLPFVYQRLFRIEPLEEVKFYEKRIEEHKKLMFAYESWKMEKFASVVMVGEKGSGATSTLNFFFKELDSGYSFLRTSITETVYDEKDLVLFFGFLFKNNYSNYKDIILDLNSAGNKKIVVLENIQHLFIRKIGGLHGLEVLFEIISTTSKNIFWVTTASLYAWKYLDNTLNISDYFGYVIKLSSFTDNQIVDVILKRHRVSGYNILFDPSDEDVKNKKYLRLSEDEKQNYLKEKYFSNLNEFANSNLSLSLLYWLRSTKEVQKETIVIKSIDKIDFSFLNVLSSEKLFTLHAILIHDGLTEQQHATIFNNDILKSRLVLLLMRDDGIIIKRDNIFTINPLLYRQTVSLLQAKNIIH